MTRTLIIALALVIAAVILAHGSASGVFWTVPAASTAACGTSDSPTATAGTCITTSGLYLSSDGGKTWQGPFPTSGVASVFGRTGAVLASANDYSFSQLGGTLAATQMPVSQTCTFSGTIALNGPSTLTITNCH